MYQEIVKRANDHVSGFNNIVNVKYQKVMYLLGGPCRHHQVLGSNSSVYG